MELLTNAQPVLDWAAYRELTADQKIMLELRANALNQAILFLINLKNKTPKKDLRLAYSQGNSTVYPTNIKAIVRYLSTKYPNNKPANQRGGKQEDKKKGNESNIWRQGQYHWQ